MLVNPSELAPTGWSTLERVGRRVIPSVQPRRWWLPALAFTAILAAHWALGSVLSRSATAATFHALATAVAAVVMTASNPRPKGVLCVCGYIVGCEVLWRMCNAAIFWETGKYLVAAVLLTALARSERFRAPVLAITYFALLLPSSLLTAAVLDWTAARQQLSFNLSGPLTLALAVIYFSNVRLEIGALRATIMAISGPVAAIIAVVLRRMAALGEIDFAMDSNFGASGGFGPNQVSAILGLGGLFCLLALILCPLNLPERVVALALAALTLVQSALTFSRGGVYLATTAVAEAGIFLVSARIRRGRLFLAGIVLLLTAAAFLPYAEAWTGGRLIERFTTLDLTHRDELIRDDLAIWSTHPFFGVGPGLAAEERGSEFGGAAAHTEFTRALAEHGLFGLGSIAVLGWMTWHRFSQAATNDERALLAALLVWPLLFMAVNSMRLAAPSLLYGMAFARWSASSKSAERPGRAVSQIL